MRNILVFAIALLINTSLYANVDDRANVLSQEERTSLEGDIGTIRASGIQAGILILPQNSEPTKDTALRFLKSCGFGNDSFVIVVTLNPRQIYIQPGPGFYSVLNRSYCDTLSSQTLAPKFASGNFFDGLATGLKAIESRIYQARNPVVETPAEPQNGSIVVAMICLAITVFMGIFAFMGFHNSNSTPTKKQGPTYRASALDKPSPPSKPYSPPYTPPSKPSYPKAKSTKPTKSKSSCSAPSSCTSYTAYVGGTHHSCSTPSSCSSSSSSCSSSSSSCSSSSSSCGGGSSF